MIDEKQSVNFIKHLTGVIHKISDDDRLSPSHFSMYISLFHEWNKNRFKNPFYIIRSDIMVSSKVKSKSTYHRCIRELHSYGYIEYFPSKNAATGSKIIIKTFDDEKISIPVKNHSPKIGLPNSHDNPVNGHPMEQHNPKNGLPIEPFNKHINNKKHINLYIPQKEKKENNFSEKGNFIPPSIQDVCDFFKEKNKLQIEAEIFYNHYKSNGWKISAKTHIVDWKAAAEKWILSNEKYQLEKSEQSLNHLHTNHDKDYHIPL